MSQSLLVSIGQYSDRGRKAENQDFHGAFVPKQPQLDMKGVALAIADGISSSQVSQCASQTAITSFLSDYYCTPDSWSVKTAGQRVIASANSWLVSQTKNSPYRYNKDKGYICTFSAMVLKSNTAHIFHCGDSRIYRVVGGCLEQLTIDHEQVVDSQTSYLTRALGMHDLLELDYRAVAVEVGDTFVLSTDGVHGVLDESEIARCITESNSEDLDAVAKHLVQLAFDRGSKDNLTLQIVRVEDLPFRNVSELQSQVDVLPAPPVLSPRMEFDGYKILRELYISSRSHVFLAMDSQTQQQVVIKTPSVEQRNDRAVLEAFLMEDWIARRVHNAHVLKAYTPNRKANYLYTVTEYIEGKNLAQWMADNPKPSLDAVRDILSQIGKGLQAFHRQEMVHQDLRPNNVMIDAHGVVKIIDFGSTLVAGIAEVKADTGGIKGTAQFTAPEYFLGRSGTPCADVFSLGVLAYKMLSGSLPYGTAIAKTRTQKEQSRLRYKALTEELTGVPDWVDYAIRRATEIDPNKRYQEVSEFVYELSQPSQQFLRKHKAPLMERDPVRFWQCVSLALFSVLVYQMLG